MIDLLQGTPSSCIHATMVTTGDATEPQLLSQPQLQVQSETNVAAGGRAGMCASSRKATPEILPTLTESPSAAQP